MSLADILSRPVATDLFSLFKSEKNFVNTGRTELKTLVCAGDAPDNHHHLENQYHS